MVDKDNVITYENFEEYLNEFLIIKTFYVYVNIIQLVIGIIFMIIGIIISSFLG